MADPDQLDPLKSESPVVGAALEEIETPGEPAADIIDLALLPQAEQDRIYNEVNEAVNRSLEEIAVDASDISPEGLTPVNFEKIQEDLKRVQEEMAADVQKPGWYKYAYSLLVSLIAPFVNLTTNAGIPNKRYLSQDLNKIHRPELPDAQFLARWLLRFPNDKTQFTDKLQRLGYTDEDIQKYIDMSEALPGPQDVVSFMVREVYNQDIRDSFQLDSGFDRLYAYAKEDADKAGVSRETLGKFWAAHWRLPGINQAFEMLHRGEIDLTKLKQLLQAADIMPGFIDNLVNISYSPYTRVDVRRMHKLGILSDAELIKAYKDLGYDEEKAANLAKFTIEYNKDPEDSEKTDADKQRDLTKSDILRIYKLRMIPRADVYDFLTNLGYSRDETDLYIDRVDMELELDRVEEQTRLIRKAYLAGIYNDSQAGTELDKLNVTADQRAELLADWQLEKTIKTQQPSKSEILKWYKNRQIDEPTAREWLGDHGYPLQVVNLYLDDNKPPET